MRGTDVRVKDGTRLHVVESGSRDGRPVLFLHGWPDSWFTFSRVFPALPDSLRAVAVDQRGFGESDRPGAGYSIPELAADAIAAGRGAGLDGTGHATVNGATRGLQAALRSCRIRFRSRSPASSRRAMSELGMP